MGKGAAVNPAMSLLKDAATANTLSDRLTIEYVLEKLSKGFTAPAGSSSGTGITFTTDASALIFSSELSIFITASLVTLPILADLWDAREGDFHYGTRHKGDYKITSPCISLLGGSTQEWLIDAIPNNAVGGGFTRRVNFVFAKEKSQFIPFPVSPNSHTVKDSLVEDLRYIASHLRGEFRFAKDVEPIFDKFYRAAVPNEYDDEATTAYVTTKWAHATKLAMAISASRSDSLVISKSDFEQAVVEVEQCSLDLQLVFRAVGESDLVSAADRVLKFIEKKGYASRSDILRSNWRHVSASDLDVIILTLTQGGLLIEKQSGNKIVYTAIPQTKVSP